MRRPHMGIHEGTCHTEGVDKEVGRQIQEEVNETILSGFLPKCLSTNRASPTGWKGSQPVVPGMSLTNCLCALMSRRSFRSSLPHCHGSRNGDCIWRQIR